MSVQMKMLSTACLGYKLVCHTPMRTLLPRERDRLSSFELLFEARESFVTQRVVICGGRAGERPGATGQHSRQTRVFSFSITCMCFRITRHKIKQELNTMFAGNVSIFFYFSCELYLLSFHFLTCFLSDTFWEGCRLMTAIIHLWPWANTRMMVKHEQSRGRKACVSCFPLRSLNNRKECRFYCCTNCKHLFYSGTFL